MTYTGRHAPFSSLSFRARTMHDVTFVRSRDELAPALAAGGVVVTPNNRLARHLVARYDRAQRAAGRDVWTAPAVVPWNAWLETLWLDVLASGCRPEPPLRIAPGQSRFLWTRIVAAEALPLMDEQGAANLAAEAWMLAHAWGAGGPSWRAWSGGDGDPAVFARWAEDYGRAIGQLRGLDAAQLPDWVAACAAEVPAWRGSTAMLAGFIELSPQQDRLLTALAEAGMHVEHTTTSRRVEGDAVAAASRETGDTPRDEVTRALRWARDRALADPDATVGIAIEGLESRRAEIRALADEILCPALQWPGREDEDRPWNLSLGTALGDVPLVASALDLVALMQAPLPMSRAAMLLRSPYVEGAPGEWLARAGLETAWLCEGRREVSLAAIVATVGPDARAFGQLLQVATGTGRTAVAPRAWAQVWRTGLASAGWPGARALSSVEWQARTAWDELLTEFAALGFVTPRMSHGEAVAALGALARNRVFQPESAPARVEILGLLEAAALPLDGLWVAGLAADAWPPAPRPNPLLPLQWQRERNVPRSSAARELAYAKALTDQWARGAPEVVFSCAAIADDHPRTMSSLVAAAPMRSHGAPPLSPAHVQFDTAPAQESVADDSAPPYADGAVARGGAGMIARQADCPFQAVARYRLRTERWPEPLDGLNAAERGNLVHAALAAFWRDVVDRATLIGMAPDVLARRVDAAVATAAAAIPAVRWSRLPPAVAAGEATRIGSALRGWLDEVDRRRPDFTVVATEASRPLALGGLEWTLRVDRIDALADGGTAIIDYKTGVVATPAQWFGERAREPQLGLYWLAQAAFEPERTVRAVAYARVRPGETEALGLAADATAWPGLLAPADIRRTGLADWPAVEERWRETLEALATAVHAGHSAVAPRDTGDTCKRCGRQALCRIRAFVADDDAEPRDG
jgi:probable DNA repair protein